MKTTYDIPEALVKEINRIARERGLPARAIVQQALTRVVEEERTAEPFVLPDASVDANEVLTPWGREQLERPGGLNELILASYERDR